MYTPTDSKETFSHLLCRRLEAFQQLDNFQSGLEDAVNASKMCPEMSEVGIPSVVTAHFPFLLHERQNQIYNKHPFQQVYLHQHKCFQALKRKKEAMHAANECLKRTTDENFIYRLLCDALATAASLKGKD